MACAGGAGLVGCSTSDSPGATATTVTSTVTATPSQASGATTPASGGTDNQDVTTTEPANAGGSGNAGGAGDSGGTACSTDGAHAITDATARIARPLPSFNPSVGWLFLGRTNYNTCNDLSYAELDTEGATASSPMQLLLFHRGRFVGTGIKCNVAYQNVESASTRSVDVTYRYLQGNDPGASPSGSVSVAFIWDGSKVVMHGSLPHAVTYGRC